MMDLNPPSLVDSGCDTTRPLVSKVREMIASQGLSGRASRAQEAPAFDVFRFMRVRENDLSVILADLLDPRGTHGQGALFLDNFLARLETAHWKRSSAPCHVRLEHATNERRRIDITLTFPHGVIGVENKPWAVDQEAQLGHYADFLSHRGRQDDWNWLLVFLCNRPPAEYSLSAGERLRLGSSGQFVHFSFQDAVLWLTNCREKCQSSKVRYFLDDLVRFIQTAINGEMVITDRSEVVQTLMEPENIEAAFVIAQTLDATKRALLEDFRGKLESAANALGYSVEWRFTHWIRGAGFYLRQSAADRLAVGFEFEGGNLTSLVWGLSDTRREGDPLQLARESEVHRRAAAVMAGEFQGASASSGWPWYSPPNDASLTADLSHWDKAAAPWQQMASGQLLSAILERTQRVFKAFRGQEWLLQTMDSSIEPLPPRTVGPNTP